MKTRSLCVALFLLGSSAGTASAATAARSVQTDPVPLAEATAPLRGMLKSGTPAVRNAVGTILVDIVRKHPAAANDLIRTMAAEENAAVSAEHERLLVPLAKESP